MALEILVASYRQKEFLPYARQWLECVQNFWATIGRAGSRDDEFGWFLTEFYIGLLVHSAGVGRPFECTVTNNEIIDRAILGRAAHNPFWYQQCLERVLADRKSSPASTKSRGRVVERLLTAGAEIIATEGPDKLTFRLLSAKANTVRSAIHYHFPTQRDLLYGILQHTIKEAVSRAAERRLRQMESSEAYVDEIAAHYLDPWLGDIPMIVVIAEIHELAAHDRNLEDIAWHSRMAQGVIAYELVDPGSNEAFSTAPFDSHAGSTWVAGCALTHMALQDRSKARSIVAGRIAYGLNVFQGLWPLQWQDGKTETPARARHNRIS
jgi:AcrR family transcriptional regulator